MRSLLLLAVLLSASEWTLAQSRPRPDPADPGAAAPPLSYQSTFSDYQPSRDEKVRSWKEVNKEVADNPGMGSMKHGAGMAMPGMDSKASNAPKGKEGTAGHNTGSMKDKPGMAMAGMDSKAGNAPKGKEGAAGHDMGSMKDKPGKTMPGMDMPAASAPKNITGTGSVQLIDKANGKVKLTHEPIAAMGWPKMTLFFRLKERSLADQVKEGDRVGFTLEKSASGYVISGFQKPISESNPAVNVPKPAGHGKH
jgi:Cu/Ag efflux protein CusF